MERTAKSKVIKWQKTGGGSFRMGNKKLIKPGQIFSATIEEIPIAFRDVVKPVDGKDVLVTVDAAALIKTAPELKYYVKHVNSGWYNVEDVNGKVMNDKKLRQEAAEGLLKSLQ